MARRFICDFCAVVADAPTGKGNQRPLGWGSIRMNVRGDSVSDSDGFQWEACPSCTERVIAMTPDGKHK